MTGWGRVRFVAALAAAVALTAAVLYVAYLAARAGGS